MEKLLATSNELILGGEGKEAHLLKDLSDARSFWRMEGNIEGLEDLKSINKSFFNPLCIF